MMRIILAFFIVLSLGSWAYADGHLPEEKIAASAAQWSKLYAARDLDSLMTLYHPDAMLFAHNQPGRVGREAIRAFFKESFSRTQGAEIDFKIENITVFGNAANLVSLYKMEIDVGAGQPIVVVGRSMLMYKRADDGRWLLFADMDNLAPDATVARFAEVQ
ncbi:MAG: SgcJ/EcaC family oxidoreductase [Pseudomonadota bacterium]